MAIDIDRSVRTTFQYECGTKTGRYENPDFDIAYEWFLNKNNATFFFHELSKIFVLLD